MELPTLIQLVSFTAWLFSVISFGFFCVLLRREISARNSKRHYPSLEDAEVQGALDDTAKLIDSLSKLAESFSKAGPLVMTLVSSIFFFLAALTGSGFDKIIPPK
jgi:hypothetical protein